ncbi:MAG: gliding motility-associated C-terminal domain-containing protein, partial [Catalinimonas sp.]
GTAFFMMVRTWVLCGLWLAARWGYGQDVNPGFEVQPVIQCVGTPVEVVDDETNRLAAYDSGADGDTTTFSTTSNGQADTTYTYNQPGVYLITQLVDAPDSVDYLDRLVRRRVVIADNLPPEATWEACAGQAVRLRVDDRDVSRFRLPGRDYGTYAVADTTVVYEQYVVDWGDGTSDVRPGPTFIIDHTYAAPGAYVVRVQGLYPLAVCGGTDQRTLNVFDDLAEAPLTEVTVATDGTPTLLLTPGTTGRTELSRTRGGGGVAPFDTLDAGGGTTPVEVADVDAAAETWCFRTRTYDVCGNERPGGRLCTTRLRAQTLPASGSIRLSWPTYPGGGFMSYVLTRDGRPLQTVPNVATTSYEDTDVVCNQTYAYELTVMLTPGSDGTARRSVAAPVTIEAESTIRPPVVERLVATFDFDNQLLVSWEPPAEPPTQYEVRRGGEVVATTTEASFEEVASGRSCYGVRYVDECGNASPPGEQVCPAWLQGVRTGGGIELNWSEYKGHDVRRYVVERLDADGNLLDERPVAGLTYAEVWGDDFDPDRQLQLFHVRVEPDDPALPVVFSNVISFRVSPRLFFPDAFSPNGDGNNDRFRAFGKYIATYDLRVYNRWGEVIYQDTDFRGAGWDGTSRGRPVPAGTYAYTVRAL